MTQFNRRRQPTVLVDPRVFFDWKKLFACRVKILIVTDASGGFDGTQGFHLGQVLDILASDPWSHVIFEVTKAHRQTEPTADIPNFRFDQHDLTDFDQIWLFGVHRAGPDVLSQAELRALAEFMDGGGGVFATGDHENLGQAVCAEVPRVRSMRRWYYPGPGPNGEPEAPAVSGIGSHNTLTDDPATPPLELDQSDKIPQEIRPHYYTAFSGSIFHKFVKFPHPVLCGPSGVINYLPDHMHEGLCEVPADLTKSYTFDGYTTEEYPTVGAHRTAPEVIAYAENRNNGQEFGVIAVYDGHRAKVGRVLVDATWHHWFNINLVGLLAATNDPTNPAYDPTVVPKWEEIKAYYRNVAAWLSPPPLQRCLRNGGWLFVTRYYDILMSKRDLETVSDQLQYFWQLGVFARDALGRRASQCQRTQWWLDLAHLMDLRFVPDLWGPRPPEPDPPPWIDLEDLEAVLLGGAVHALSETFADIDDVEPVVERSDEIERAARGGAERALAELVEGHVRSARTLERYISGQSPGE